MAVLIGADKSCGLDYLRMTPEDRELANQVIEKAYEFRAQEMKHQAIEIANAVWGAFSDG